jgi:hypothetical protein
MRTDSAISTVGIKVPSFELEYKVSIDKLDFAVNTVFTIEELKEHLFSQNIDYEFRPTCSV